RPLLGRTIERTDDRDQQERQNPKRNCEELALVPRVRSQDDEGNCQEQGGQREQFHGSGSFSVCVGLQASQTSLEGSGWQIQGAPRQSLIRSRQAFQVTAFSACRAASRPKGRSRKLAVRIMIAKRADFDVDQQRRSSTRRPCLGKNPGQAVE